MYKTATEEDAERISIEVYDWLHRTDINGTVSAGGAAILASVWACQASPALLAFVESYQLLGNPIAGCNDTHIDALVREIEQRRRSVFLDDFYSEDEKEWNCDDLDALQAWVEVHGGVRARV
jgi:hypothetical protein